MANMRLCHSISQHLRTCSWEESCFVETSSQVAFFKSRVIDPTSGSWVSLHSRSVGGGHLFVCMMGFSDLQYSLSFSPANMAIVVMLSICMACKAVEQLKHLWLNINRSPTLSIAVLISSNIHNLCFATLFPPILCAFGHGHARVLQC